MRHFLAIQMDSNRRCLHRCPCFRVYRLGLRDGARLKDGSFDSFRGSKPDAGSVRRYLDLGRVGLDSARACIQPPPRDCRPLGACAGVSSSHLAPSQVHVCETPPLAIPNKSGFWLIGSNPATGPPKRLGPVAAIASTRIHSNSTCPHKTVHPPRPPKSKATEWTESYTAAATSRPLGDFAGDSGDQQPDLNAQVSARACPDGADPPKRTLSCWADM